MSTTTIGGLNALSSTIASGDKLAVEHSGVAYKIDYDALATAILGKLGASASSWIVPGTHGGTGTNVQGAIHVETPTTSDGLDVMYTNQPVESVRIIPSGIYQGSVVGPDGNAGGWGWVVISHKYSSVAGYQWGFVSNHIYTRCYNSAAYGGWTEWELIA